LGVDGSDKILMDKNSLLMNRLRTNVINFQELSQKGRIEAKNAKRLIEVMVYEIELNFLSGQGWFALLFSIKPY
jgi:hypothetical protein